jgi:hypothetical protein
MTPGQQPVTNTHSDEVSIPRSDLAKRLPALKTGGLYKTHEQHCDMVLERPFRPVSFGTERAAVSSDRATSITILLTPVPEDFAA